MNKLISIIVCLSLAFSIKAQTISGTLSAMPNQRIKFGTFSGLTSGIKDSTITDQNGIFHFKISVTQPGIGYLVSAENKPYFLILDKQENIHLKGESLTVPETMRTLQGQQNQAFIKYASEHTRREQGLSAWTYLQKMYAQDSLFNSQKITKIAIETETQRIKNEDENFIKNLGSKSYVAWYLPTRRLVSDVSTIARYRPDEIAATISAFRKLNYADERLHSSGILRDAIESHFWLLENSGKSIDQVFTEMKLSIDSMFIHLTKDEKKLNEITNYLFDLLERHSLFQASEYLALKVLNEVSCTINHDLAKQLETYRAMKKGNIAPNIQFNTHLFSKPNHSGQSPQTLSDLTTPYTLVVFGANWCPKCREELPEIAKLYAKWKNKGLEVVFVSLDENEQDFKSFTSSFPFISLCDLKKWKSPIVESYYVFGTPTLFLLDKKREIILRPNSVKQMDAWVDWYLIQGNKPPVSSKIR